MIYGGLAELVDAYALGAYDFGHESSSLLSPTIKPIGRHASFEKTNRDINKTSHSNNTRRYKFVARGVAFDKDVAKVSEEKEGGSWFFREWLVLGTSIERCEGSSPFSPTRKLYNYESNSRKHKRFK